MLEVCRKYGSGLVGAELFYRKLEGSWVLGKKKGGQNVLTAPDFTRQNYAAAVPDWNLVARF